MESMESREAEIKLLTKLKEKIERMSTVQHVELFRIIKTNGVEFNENKNGIFINLSNMDIPVVEMLREYITYVEEQQQIINEQEKTKTNYIKQYFSYETNVDTA